MRTLGVAVLLAVVLHVAGRRFWRWWAAFDGLPSELVRRST